MEKRLCTTSRDLRTAKRMLSLLLSISLLLVFLQVAAAPHCRKETTPLIKNGTPTDEHSALMETQSRIKPPKFLLSPGQKAVDRRKYRPFWLLVSQKRRLAVTFVPKVMCSSIRSALHKLECKDDIQRTKFRCAEARKNSKLKRDMDLMMSNLTRVVILRDPFERLFSAYSNANNNPYIHLEDCQNKTQCTIVEWVDEMMRNKAFAFRNEHFKPQAEIAQMHSMHYHYYLRLSSSIDQRFFWNELVGTEAWVKNKSLPNSTSAGSTEKNGQKVMEVFASLPKSTLDKIAALYKNDLILWQQVLRRGAPRIAGEELTVFDYYTSLLADQETG